MSVDVRALKQELRDDPLGLGYAPLEDTYVSDLRVSRMLNDKAVNELAPSLTRAELWNLLTREELAVLMADSVGSFMMDLPSVDLPKDGAAMTTFAELFPADRSDVLARLSQARTRKTSRAVQLFGEAISPSEVSRARKA
jgi:hypothetical protein